MVTRTSTVQNTYIDKMIVLTGYNIWQVEQSKAICRKFIVDLPCFASSADAIVNGPTLMKTKTTQLRLCWM